MRWSWRLGSVAGIGIHIHATFALLVGAIAAFELLTKPLAVAAFQVSLLVALFASVLLHELGHAFTARAFGIRTREITLLPIGGVARLERMPREPLHEFLVAIAGPAVNVALALLLVAAFVAAGGRFEDVLATPEDGAPRALALSGFLGSLAGMNLVLGAFNLLPAYPLDGGKLLRALLGAFTSHGRATRIAAGIGGVLALLLGLLAVWQGSLMLGVVAAFLFVAGRQDAAMTTTRELLAGLEARDAMATRFVALTSYQSLEEAVAAFLGTPQEDFPVVGDDGRYFGLLARADLLRALARRGTSARVIDATRRGTKPLSPNDPLPEVLDRLTEEGASALPVLEDGRLVGLVTPDGIRKLLLVREATKQRR